MTQVPRPAAPQPPAATLKAAPPAPPPPPVTKAPPQPNGTRLALGPLTATIERSELLLRIGNIQGARGILEDAVRAEHPDAIAELGRTYDPLELANYLVPKDSADPQRALQLYRRAAELGSAVARTRSEKLQAHLAGRRPSR